MFPSIWEVYNKSYRDVTARENAWKQIAIEERYDKYNYIASTKLYMAS